MILTLGYKISCAYRYPGLTVSVPQLKHCMLVITFVPRIYLCQKGFKAAAFYGNKPPPLLSMFSQGFCRLG